MKKIIITIAGVLFMLHGLSAKEKTAINPNDGFNQRLTEQSAVIRSIVCRFTETKQISMINNPVVSTGDFYYLKENNLALLYDAPQGDQIIMSKGKFKITSNGKTNTVSMNSNSMLRQMNNMLTACFTGDISLLTAGAKTNYYETQDTYIVEISPSKRKVRENMSLIVLIFDKKDMLLNSMKIENTSGDYTEYEFTDKAFNVEVDSNHFNL